MGGATVVMRSPMSALSIWLTVKSYIIYLLDKSNACNLLTAHVHTIDKWTFEKVMQAENNKLIIMIIYYATNTT